MLFKYRLIERYTLGAILPYFLLALTLLSLAILTQQSTRFAEVLGGARTTLRTTALVLVNLLPPILSFTIPTATLLGTIIGFGRMNGDSELVALRAAGIGKYRVALLPILLGILLCVLTFYLSFVVAPTSARGLRRVAILSALQKLESPVEPGVFFTELPGKVLFVRDGMKESGRWGRVFIHWSGQDGTLRLITARAGKIDSSASQSELVLEDAQVVTVPNPAEIRPAGKDKQVTLERSSLIRMKDERLDTARQNIARLLDEREKTPEEMGWRELRANIREASTEGRRASFTSAFQRKLALCLAPLLFAFFGVGVGLSMKRGGRGLALVISIATLLLYYLLTVGGDNLGRSGLISQVFGAWAANGLLGIIGMFVFLRAERLRGGGFRRFIRLERVRVVGNRRHSPRGLKLRLNWGLMDRYILWRLTLYFALAFTVLILIFLIFTLFDLFRFTAVREGNWEIIVRYILFLIPFASLAMAPMGVLVAVLTVYALMARNSEGVAWWASGRSVYRLALPTIVFAAGIGSLYLTVQENVLPQSNRTQNTLRDQIRGRSQSALSTGREWLSSHDMRVIYNYAYNHSDQGISLKNPVIFKFDEAGVHLEGVIFGKESIWDGAATLKIKGVDSLELSLGRVEVFNRIELELEVAQEQFKPPLNRPSEMTEEQLSASLTALRLRHDPDAAIFSMLIEGRRADPLAPLVLALVAMPLGFAFGRKSALLSLCSAVMAGLSFWAVKSLLFQLGSQGLLPVLLAAWAPAISFGALGVYLLSRTRT